MSERPTDYKESMPLTLDDLSITQLKALDKAWRASKDNDSMTPSADIRTALSDSGVNFLKKFNTSNHEIQNMAETSGKFIEQHEMSEKAEKLKSIIKALESADTYADKRSALTDIIGFRKQHHMTNGEIDQFIANRRQELNDIQGEDEAYSLNEIHDSLPEAYAMNNDYDKFNRKWEDVSQEERNHLNDSAMEEHQDRTAITDRELSHEAALIENEKREKSAQESLDNLHEEALDIDQTRERKLSDNAYIDPDDLSKLRDDFAKKVVKASRSAVFGKKGLKDAKEKYDGYLQRYFNNEGIKEDKFAAARQEELLNEAIDGYFRNTKTKIQKRGEKVNDKYDDSIIISPDTEKVELKSKSSRIRKRLIGHFALMAAARSAGEGNVLVTAAAAVGVLGYGMMNDYAQIIAAEEQRRDLGQIYRGNDTIKASDHIMGEVAKDRKANRSIAKDVFLTVRNAERLAAMGAGYLAADVVDKHVFDTNPLLDSATEDNSTKADQDVPANSPKSPESPSEVIKSVDTDGAKWPWDYFADKYGAGDATSTINEAMQNAREAGYKIEDTIAGPENSINRITGPDGKVYDSTKEIVSVLEHFKR